MIQSDIPHSDIHSNDIQHNSDIHNSDIQHNDKMNSDFGAISRSDDLSGLEEGKLEIDEDRNQSSLIEDEDRYQLPDTQNQELQSGVYREERRPVDVPVSIQIPDDRGVEPVIGEPQLHVNEMSSTVSSPGRLFVLMLQAY